MLAITASGPLAQVTLDGTTQLIYTVPSGKIAFINEILINCVTAGTFKYWIGGSANIDLILPPTALLALDQIRDILCVPLTTGTTIYANRSGGTGSIGIFGSEWLL